MKKVIYSFLLMILIAPVLSLAEDLIVEIAPEPANSAWWLRIRFYPVHDNIRGIPVKELDPSWRKASELKKEAIPVELLTERTSDGEYNDLMEYFDTAFSVTGDFNIDGSGDMALVGVYESENGEYGKFLLVLTKSDAGNWQKLFIRKYEGRPGFGVLKRNVSNIELWSCFYCDGVSWYIWDPKEKSFIVKFPNFED